MIPELGHFALILALCLALAQGMLPLIGAQRGNLSLMALARPAAQGQFVFYRHFVSMSDLQLRRQRFLGALCRLEFQYGIAAGISHRGGMGRARRFVAVVGLHPQRLDARRDGVQPQPAAGYGRARDRGDGLDQRRLSVVHARHLEPVRTPVPGRARRSRFESAAARSRLGVSSTDAVHGLCRLLGGLLRLPSPR